MSLSLSLSDLHFDVKDLATLRLLQIHAFTRDLVETTNADDELQKRTQLRAFVESTREWADAAGVPEAIHRTVAAHGGKRLDAAAQELEALKNRVDDDKLTLLLLELVASTNVPKGTKWAGGRLQYFAEGARRLDAGISQTRIEALAKTHGRALRRLSLDALSPTFRLALVAGSVALTVASGGVAAAAGTAIGGAMGLSGAAATSAGLAFLGGGSIAAGGFGMAGGAVLVTAVSKAGYMGTRYLAASIATRSPEFIINELAKLEVICGARPEFRTDVLRQLEGLRAEMKKTQKKKSGDEAKNLAKSLRAIDAAIRSLTDSSTQRVLRKATRVVPVSWLERQVDRL